MRRLLFREKNSENRRGPRLVPGREALRRPTLAALVAAAAAAILAGAGCGARGAPKGILAVADEASTDYHFFSVPRQGEAQSPAGSRGGRGREELIEMEIERLGSASWESARDRLFKLGKEVIPRLFANIERTEPTQVGVRLVPGPAVPERNDTWTFGQLAYAVLVEFVGGYTNYEGSTLPPLDKRAWEEWWVKNKKNLEAYSDLGAVPEYVRKQQEAAREELALRFPNIEAGGLKEKKALDLDKEKAEKERKARERERRLERLKKRPKAEEAGAASRRRRTSASSVEPRAEEEVREAETGGTDRGLE